MTRSGTDTRLVRLLATLAVIAVACGHPPSVRSNTRSVAFLRAVPGSASELVFEELRRAGFVRGENLDVLDDPESYYVDPERTAAAVERWSDAGVDLILAFSTSGTRVAAEAAPQVPIVSITNDPVATGLVADGSHPEGSITGVTFRVPADRTLDVGRRALSGLRTVALVYPDGDPAAAPHRDSVLAAGRELGIGVRPVAFTADDVTDVVASVPADTDAIFVANAPTAVRLASVIVAAAAGRRLPILANSSYITGATVVLEPDTDELTRQMGRQAARILRGVSTAQVPVEDPISYRLVIDVGAAERLGFRVPDAVLREADEVLR